MGERPLYRVLQDTFVEGRGIVGPTDPDNLIEFDGTPGFNLEPVNDAARAAYDAAATSLPALAAAPLTAQAGENGALAGLLDKALRDLADARVQLGALAAENDALSQENEGFEVQIASLLAEKADLEGRLAALPPPPPPAVAADEEPPARRRTASG